MIPTCHPISQAIAQDMLRSVVEAICDRPGQSKAQRDARSADVVHSVLAFQPRDPVEMMFAGIIVTHFHLILHSAHAAFGDQPEELRPRTRSGIVALDRAMVGFVKELHVAKTRPMAEATETATEPEAMPERVAVAPVQRNEPSAVAERAAAPASSRTGTSTTAMLAVLSPPTGPLPVNQFAAVRQPFAGNTRVPSADVGRVPDTLPGLPRKSAPTAGSADTRSAGSGAI